MENKVQEMKKWKIKFWTPGNRPTDDGASFGCATHGFCSNDGWIGPEKNANICWRTKLYGTVISGSYFEVLKRINDIDFIPKVAIAVFATSLGMEEFLESWNQIPGSFPIIGGGAAIGTGQERGEILPEAEEVAVLIIADGEYIVQTNNIHDDIGIKMDISTSSKRSIKDVKVAKADWENAVEFYKMQQSKRNISDDDFESLTFSDSTGRNVHLSISGDILESGANLPVDNVMYMRKATKANTENQIRKFCDIENGLVFGCAGLRSLVEHEIYCGENTIAVFLFGELITLQEKPQFANLMMARIIKTQ